MKKENIRIFDHNVFEEKSKMFLESQKARRLQDKYQPSPYEEEYEPFYYLALFGSYLCNAISILTASTWLFSYVFSILKDTPSPEIIASLVTLIVLVLVEVMQRAFGTKFFQFKLQYRKTAYGLLVGALIGSAVSMLFSINGGFDFIKVVTTPPVYEVPKLESEKDVEQRFQKFIADAQKTADNYYNRRKYKERIATEDAKKYQTYLDKKIIYQDSLVSAVAAVKTRNNTKLAKSKQEHQAALDAHNAKIKSQGIGLGGIAAVSITLLYLCLWYKEYYDFKTAIQYGTLVTQKHPSAKTKIETDGDDIPQIEGINDIREIMELFQQQEEKINQKTAPTPPYTPSKEGTNNVNSQISHFKGLQLPIGFFSDTERQEQVKTLYIQLIQPYIQHFKETNLVIPDKHTIKHKNFRTGELEYLDFKTVHNRVGIYLLKISNSLSKGSKGALPNQFSKLGYWLNKRGEFFDK